MTTKRQDLQIVRAIAVLAVLIFHIDEKYLPAGFFGVDVFYVLSGYLISGLIMRDISAGNFKISTFMARRFKRLFPALSFVVLLTVIGVWFIFVPSDAVPSFLSAIAALASFSNILFFTQAGYFDASSLTKPLLHTWSLGVEEQFYLIWPFILLVSVKLKIRLHFVYVIIGLVGISGFLLLSNINESAAFYLMPARIWQFSAGAFLSIFVSSKESEKRSPIYFFTGITVLLFMFYFGTVPNFGNGVAFIIVTFATLLIIWGGRTSGNDILSRIFSKIGDWSYSIYLVHWPLIVLVYYSVIKPSLPTQIGLAIISILFGYLSCRFVEKRYIGSSGDASAKWLALALALILTAVIIVFGIDSDGSWSRRGMVISSDPTFQIDPEQMRLETYGAFRGKNPPALQPFKPGDQNILVMGDSHAKDFYNSLAFARVKYPELKFEVRAQIFDDRCLELLGGDKITLKMLPSQTKNCQKNIEDLNDTKIYERASVILYVARWQSDSLSKLSYLNNWAKAQNIPLVLLTRTPEFGNVPTMFVKFGKKDQFQRYLYENQLIEPKEVNSLLLQSSNNLNIPVYDQYPLLCENKRQICFAFFKGSLIYYDELGHFSIPGAEFLANQIYASDKFKKLLQLGQLEK